MAYYTLKSYKLWCDPWRLFLACSKLPNCFFLDSNSGFGVKGRYSFIGVDPFRIIQTKQGTPFNELRDLLRHYKLNIPKCPFPFLGGAVGCLGYEVGFVLEKKIRLRMKPSTSIPNAFFGFYNSVIIIDHAKKTITLLMTGFPEKKYTYAKALCQYNAQKIMGALSGITGSRKIKQKNSFSVQTKTLCSSFSRDAYQEAVVKAKNYIKRGDIYQVNLSQIFNAKSSDHPLDIYGRLRTISPSSLNAYFDAGTFQLLSSSPERFISLHQGTVVTSPMKGTRPRAKNKKNDARLKRALLLSEKDKAELMMIVDLERNDLGKVCDYGSIRVASLRDMEKYNTVYQTTATIKGSLYSDCDGVDVLRACFPGGSITGCPKIRAMEIIEELEPVRRSVYTGSLGYLSFSGNMDFNILIRTILKKDDHLSFGVGGGIVADSIPEDEYRETLVKAAGMFKAIGIKEAHLG